MSFYSYQIEGPLTSSIPRSQPGYVSTSLPSSLPRHEEDIPSSVSNDDHPAAVAKPPRPPNAWILYRSETIRKLKEANSPLLETSQSELSKKIAEQWKNETPEIKKWFEREAEIKKLEHAKMHPGYVFKPKRTGKSRSPGKSKSSISPPTVSSPLTQEYQLPLPHPNSQYVQLQQRSSYSSGEYHGSYESEEEERSNSGEFVSEGLDRSRPTWEKESSIAPQYSYAQQMAPLPVLSTPGFAQYQNHAVQNSYETPRVYEMYDVNGNDGYHIADAPRNPNYHDPYPSQRPNYSYSNSNNYFQRPNQHSYPMGSISQEEYMTVPAHTDYHLTSNGPIHHDSREFNDMNNSYQFPRRHF